MVRALKFFLAGLGIVGFVAIGATLPAGAAPSAAVATPSPAAVQKPLKVLINAIRYGKDDLAAQQLAIAQMATALLGGEGAKLNEAELTEFKQNLEVLLRRLSFVRGRELFKYLDAVLYAPSTTVGDKVHCKSTVVIHRDLKKEELPIEWVLVQDGGRYRVVDVITAGDSTIAAIRSEQVVPLLREGGSKALLEAMRKKIGELPK